MSKKPEDQQATPQAVMIGEGNPVVIVEEPKPLCVPPTSFKRNEYGLLTNVNYSFNADGTVNWRKLIRQENLVINKSRKDEVEKKYGKTINELAPAEIDDSYLLILLAGIKEVAQIRGFRDCSYSVVNAAKDYVAVKCRIEWSPNYETNNEPVCFESLADATLDNTFSFAKNFLMAIAENRAFVRTVRNFLKVHVLGADEIGPTKGNADANEPSASDPKTLLGNVMTSKKVSFEYLKKKMIEEKCEGADSWTCVDDIPKLKIFELINRLSKI